MHVLKEHAQFRKPIGQSNSERASDTSTSQHPVSLILEGPFLFVEGPQRCGWCQWRSPEQ